jgi:hypothetical protein
MNKKVLKVSAYVVLATVFAMAVAQRLVTAQQLTAETPEHSKVAKGIEGTWQVQVTILNCGNGNPLATFASLVTYAGGGTMSSTTSSLSPALNYPGQGVWQYVGDQRYTGAYMFFRFNSSGGFIGTQKIKQDIEYDRALDQLNITATFEVLDPNGNVVGTGCVSALGTRFE